MVSLICMTPDEFAKLWNGIPGFPCNAQFPPEAESETAAL